MPDAPGLDVWGQLGVVGAAFLGVVGVILLLWAKIVQPLLDRAATNQTTMIQLGSALQQTADTLVRNEQLQQAHATIQKEMLAMLQSSLLEVRSLAQEIRREHPTAQGG